jgi:capsular exopolysaccharide synthesis family protein
MMPPTGMPASNRFKPVDPLRLLREHVRLLAITCVVGIAVGFVCWGLLLWLTPRYTSSAQLRVQGPLTDVWGTAAGDISQAQMAPIEAFMRNEIMRLTSEEVLLNALGRPEVKSTEFYRAYLIDPVTGNFDVRRAREDLEEDYLRVYPVSGSTLINIRVSLPDEDDPPKILEALTSVYLLKLEQEAASEGSKVSRTFLSEREQAETEIRQIQDRIRQFTQTQDLDSLDMRTSAANREYQLLIEARVELETKSQEAKEYYNDLLATEQQGDVPPTSEDLIEIDNTAEMLDINRRINYLREQVTSATNTYGANHYMTRQFQHQLASGLSEKDIKVQQMVRERRAAKVQGGARMVAGFEGQLAALQPKLEVAAKRMTDLTTLLNEYEQLQDMLETAKAKRDRADESLDSLRVMGVRPDARRVQRYASATVPELTFPKIEYVVPAVALLCLGLVGGFLFLREALDQRIKGPADVRLLANADMLGLLPDAEDDPSGSFAIERVVEKHPAGLMAEAFRQVRSGIVAKMDRRGYKTLLVVSAQPGCGSSSVVHNLATALAYNGRKVLIIDANFRRPAQHRLHELANELGLVDVLRGRATLAQAVKTLPGLSVAILPTGHAVDTAPELLEAASFRAMLTGAETEYDLILIDSPPALLTSESQLLAKHVDAVAVVVRATSDKRGMIDRMIRQFEGHRADVLGIILNGVQSSAGGYFRKSYRDFYRYRQNGTATNGQAVSAKKKETATQN